MSVQGLRGLASQVQDSLASIRSGFRIGCSYDSGSVSLKQAHTALLGAERRTDEVPAHAPVGDRPEFAAA